MLLSPIDLVFFSPTGTTQRALFAIAKGYGDPAPHAYDLTLDAASAHEAGPGRLTILGAPVYAGRVAPAAAKRFTALRGNGAPAVVVVCYGNRAYEDALLELRDIAMAQGFIPIAGAAFIGEHSFSTPDAPIAPGRPDADDLSRAETFGRAVRAKLDALSPMDLASLPPLAVPGAFPYKEATPGAAFAPQTDPEACILCGTCAVVCPTAAVTVSETVITDAGACIRCCACVKSCPSKARALDAPRITEIRAWLFGNHRAPKAPEVFL